MDFICGFIIGANIVGFFLILGLVSTYIPYSSLIFPAISEICTEHFRWSNTATIIIQILFAIIFMPAILAYIALLAILVTVSYISIIIVKRGH